MDLPPDPQPTEPEIPASSVLLVRYVPNIVV